MSQYYDVETKMLTIPTANQLEDARINFKLMLQMLSKPSNPSPTKYREIKK